METTLDLSASVEIDHARDEDPVRVLAEAWREITEQLDPHDLSPGARALLRAIGEAVDDAEEG